MTLRYFCKVNEQHAQCSPQSIVVGSGFVSSLKAQAAKLGPHAIPKARDYARALQGVSRRVLNSEHSHACACACSC